MMNALRTSLLVLLILTTPARASTSGDWAKLERALSGWRVSEAAGALERLSAAGERSPRLELARGRLEILRGEYDAATRSLEKARSVGPLAKHFEDLARETAQETRGYVQRRTADGHFIVLHEPGADELLMPYLEHVLARSWTALTERLDYVPEGPIRVEIYPRVDVLGAVSPLTVEEIRTSGTIALCKYNRLMVTSPRDMVYGYSWADTVAHELVHLLITQRTYNKVPIWLHEGLAKYLETSWREPGRPTLERRSEDRLAKAVAARELISFEAMSPSMAKLPSQEAAATAFAEVFTVIDWLVEHHGPQAIGQLLDAMGAGLTDREAIEKVTALSFARFERTWKSHLSSSRLRRLDHPFDMRLLFRGHDTQATELEMIEAEEARRWIWLGDQLQLKERSLAALREYQKARDIAGDSVPMLQAKIAKMLMGLSRLKEAREALSAAVIVAPDYVLLPLLLGQIAAREGKHVEAREYFEQVLRLNPFDIEIHGLLAKTYEALGERALAARERDAQTTLIQTLRAAGDPP
jgi:tetratricopeptide (TPR) repeat protein